MPASARRRTPPQALELGYDAVLLNTAIAKAADPVAMANAFRLGVEAGRTAYEAGPDGRRAISPPLQPLSSGHRSGMPYPDRFYPVVDSSPG